MVLPESGCCKHLSTVVRAVTILRHQEWQRFFREKSKIFEQCPKFSNYVQHIFLGGGDKLWTGSRPTWFPDWLFSLIVLFICKRVLEDTNAVTLCSEKQMKYIYVFRKYVLCWPTPELRWEINLGLGNIIAKSIFLYFCLRCVSSTWYLKSVIKSSKLKFTS